MSTAAASRRPAPGMGRTFLPPLFDYLLIGGGLSLIATAALALYPAGQTLVFAAALPYLILLSNSAHFASSTVRLYTKPGTYQSLPFVTMGLPLLALGLLTVCIAFAGQLGPHLQVLYLTWSPYHYAAQAYGLAVMYGYRSGCQLRAHDKRLLYWVATIPFFYQLIAVPNLGVRWFLPSEWLAQPDVAWGFGLAARALAVLAFAAPLALFVRIWRSPSGPLPWISLLIIASNCVWWFVLTPLDAFAVATIFHGVQYMAIVMIFHVRDQAARPDNRHGALYHALWFYGAALLLGYALFQLLPYAYQVAGFGLAESMLLVAAAINIHHFVVDAFIWRLGRADSNRRIVESVDGA